MAPRNCANQKDEKNWEKMNQFNMYQLTRPANGLHIGSFDENISYKINKMGMGFSGTYV